MQDASNKYFTKQEMETLTEWFTKDQQKDVIDLAEQCANTPRGRIRKPRTRKREPGHIGRPVNSFMAYRSKIQADIRHFCPKANHRIISKIIAKWWKSTDEEEKNKYRAVADQAKKDHLKKHPGYTFRPKPKKNKKQANIKIEKKAEKYDDQDYQPSPMTQKEVLDQYTNFGGNDDQNVVSSFYLPTAIDFVPVPLTDQSGLNANNDEVLYVDPALLLNGYMDINAAEPIPFDDDSASMMAMLSNSTPASQMLETPSLGYFESPIMLFYQTSSLQQAQQDTPHLLDHAMVAPIYLGNQKKMFNELEGLNSTSGSTSNTAVQMPNGSHLGQDVDYANYLYSGANPNIMFTEALGNWPAYHS